MYNELKKCLENNFYYIGSLLKSFNGYYFQIGGYTTPFAVLGSALFLAAVITAFVLPVHDVNDEISHNTGGKLKFCLFYLICELKKLCIWFKFRNPNHANSYDEGSCKFTVGIV